jgi:catechol 2,3-dioxygenase-like lactoylglutathione lyase family enzyme
VIGRYEKTVIDCPDPRALAKFYCQVLGMRVNEDIDGWVVIGSEPGLRELAFQRATEWVPPRWPDPAHPKQLHLDIRVDDADQAEQELRALGATRASGKRETGFRVFIDPAGTHSASSSVATAQADRRPHMPPSRLFPVSSQVNAAVTVTGLYWRLEVCQRLPCPDLSCAQQSRR